MNKVVLIGNLTRDPELSETGSGVAFCRFSIAVTRRFANADGNRETDFFNITVWRGQAENCGRYLKKATKSRWSAVCRTALTRTRKGSNAR